MVSLPRTDMQSVNWSCLEYYAKLSLEFCTLHSIGCTWNRIYGPYLVAGNMSFWVATGFSFEYVRHNYADRRGLCICWAMQRLRRIGIAFCSIRLCWICFLQQFWLICTFPLNSIFSFLDVLEMVWHHRHTRKIWHSAFWYRVGLRAELLLGLIYPDTWPCFALVSTPEQIDPEVYFLWTFAIIKLHNSKLAGVVIQLVQIRLSMLELQFSATAAYLHAVAKLISLLRLRVCLVWVPYCVCVHMSSGIKVVCLTSVEKFNSMLASSHKQENDALR